MTVPLALKMLLMPLTHGARRRRRVRSRERRGGKGGGRGKGSKRKEKSCEEERKRVVRFGHCIRGEEEREKEEEGGEYLKGKGL